MPHKVIFVGEGGVGKTSLINKYLGKSIINKITLGVDFFSINLGDINMIVWDLSGQERFRYLIDSFVCGAKLAVLVFDLTRPVTLLKLENWLRILNDKVNEIEILLVGNKKDLGIRIDRDLIKNFIEKISHEYSFLAYLETSAYTGENVHTLFELIKSGLGNINKKERKSSPREVLKPT